LFHNDVAVHPPAVNNVNPLGPDVPVDHRARLDLNPFLRMHAPPDIAAYDDLQREDVAANLRARRDQELGARPNGALHGALNLHDPIADHVTSHGGPTGNDG
jgi:hypothetical protein